MQVVLIGQVGSGKTTLFNRLTNSNQNTTSGSEQITMNVTQKQSAYGKCYFNVLDSTPYGTCQNKMFNTAGLIAALTDGPVNRIIITCKFERTELMIRSIKDQLKFVLNYMHLVTIAVTHMDTYNESYKMQNAIKEEFAKLNYKSIIFTSKNDSGNDLCDKVLKELVNSKAEQINFNPQKILYLFDFEELEERLEDCLYEQIGEYQIGFNKQFKNQIAEIKKYSPKTSQEITQLCNLLLQLKNQALQQLEMLELNNQNIIMGLQKQERFILHKKLIESLEYDVKLIFLSKRKEIQNLTFVQPDHLRLLQLENIECSIQNKQWETELFLCYELCLQQLLDQIAQQKKRIVRL